MEDKEILKKTATHLNSTKTIEYESASYYQRPSRKINDSAFAKCFFDFGSDDSLIGARYHFVSKYGEEVFDGTREFSTNKNEQVVLYNNQPTVLDATSSYYMQSSIYSLRKLLPEFLSDTSVLIERKNDRIVDNQNCYTYEILIPGKKPGTGFTLVESEKDTLNFILLINKKTYLPAAFSRLYPQEYGQWKVVFKNIQFNVFRPDSVWSNDRFPREYIRLTYDEFYSNIEKTRSLTLGKHAPDWTLPMIKGDSLTLSGLKGSLTLLEFWFPYCHGCISSIPDLNEIANKYEISGLKVYGIEFQNTKVNLNEYIEKYGIEFPVLYNGKSAANEFGVYAAPTFFLIDREGKLIYMRTGFDKESILEAIDSNLDGGPKTEE